MQHPKLHMSDAVSYLLHMREISGALYHLDPMWEERHLFSSGLPYKSNSLFLWAICLQIIFFNSSSLISCYKPFFKIESRIRLVLPPPLPMWQSGIVLEIPKSQIFTSHLELTRMLPGLMSLWSTFAECINLTAHRRLYMIKVRWSFVRPLSGPRAMRSAKSDSMYSITKNNI